MKQEGPFSQIRVVSYCTPPLPLLLPFIEATGLLLHKCDVSAALGCEPATNSKQPSLDGKLVALFVITSPFFDGHWRLPCPNGTEMLPRSGSCQILRARSTTVLGRYKRRRRACFGYFRGRAMFVFCLFVLNLGTRCRSVPRSGWCYYCNMCVAGRVVATTEVSCQGNSYFVPVGTTAYYIMDTAVVVHVRAQQYCLRKQPLRVIIARQKMWPPTQEHRP